MGKIQASLNWHGPRAKRVTGQLTHEAFIHQVAALGIGKLDAESAMAVNGAKLTYGAGQSGLRGVTYFNRWLNDKEEQTAFVEICAQGEENPVQLAGTTLHELGHVLAGLSAGHSKEWKGACGKLGLRRIQAAGTNYQMAMFTPDIRLQVAMLIAQLEKARPSHGSYGRTTPKPCSMGIGTRGGTSRGAGSGSRLRKYQCMCGQILRASTDSLDATHNPCGAKFVLAS